MRPIRAGKVRGRFVIGLIGRIRRDSGRLIGRRRYHHTTRSWCGEIHARCLDFFPGLPVPGRGRIFTAAIKGVERPLFYRQGSSDLFMLREIFVAGEYEPALKFLSGPPEVILDLGANVGYSVRLWAGKFPGARIVAVEPEAENVAMFRRNVRGRAGSLTLVQAFASASDGTAFLDRSGGACANKCSGSPVGADFAEVVPKLSVETILECSGLAGCRIDLLKCDIEGAEADIFRRCEGWIGMVGCIAVETHAPYTPSLLSADLATCGARFKRSWCVEKENGLGLFFGSRATDGNLEGNMRGECNARDI